MLLILLEGFGLYNNEKISSEIAFAKGEKRESLRFYDKSYGGMIRNNCCKYLLKVASAYITCLSSLNGFKRF